MIINSVNGLQSYLQGYILRLENIQWDNSIDVETELNKFQGTRGDHARLF